MRHLLLATATALAIVAVSTSPANAQIVIIDGSNPAPPGFYSIRTPYVYGGFAVNNGVITTFPTYPPFGYPAFGYPGIVPYSSYPSYPGQYPFSPRHGYSGYPGTWRP